MPPEWGYTDETQVGPIRGAALPMGFNRTPHYTRGLLLVGDAGGMVNPFNGEGIAYAMESGAARGGGRRPGARPPGRRVARARAAGLPGGHEAGLGGYYTLGRLFVKLIGNPEVMKLATRHGLPRPLLMKFTLKLLANLTDAAGRRRDGPDHQRPDAAGARRLTDSPSSCPTSCTHRAPGPRRDDVTELAADTLDAATALSDADAAPGWPRTASVTRDDADVTCADTIGATFRAGRQAVEVAAHEPVRADPRPRRDRVGFAAFSIVAGSLAGPKRYNRAKLDAYECGIEPTPHPAGGGRFPVKYYLVAMLFIVFDIEIIFLYP